VRPGKEPPETGSPTGHPNLGQDEPSVRVFEEDPPKHPALYCVMRGGFGYVVCRDGTTLGTTPTLIEAESIVARMKAIEGLHSKEPLVVYLDEDGSLERIWRGVGDQDPFVYQTSPQQ
jgi:hypothetical protein